MAFVEILNIILTSNNIMDVNKRLIGRNINPAFGSLSGHFRWSYSDQPFHAVATHGIQFTRLFRATHIQHPFRYAGKQRQAKGQYGNELKTYIST